MHMFQQFRDRRDAGRSLARLLTQYRGHPRAIVLALPRGGVPVGYEVAQALQLPMDVFVVRKLGVPGQEELALGAIASGGHRVINVQLVEMLGLAPEVVDSIAEREGRELARRERVYRGDRPEVELRDRVVILVDDGLATGSTMRVAVEAARAGDAARVIVAVPVAPMDTMALMREDADEVVACLTPRDFMAVGEWYANFGQTRDDEVVELLNRAERFERTA
jgi:putative phosphoribosyl transferase